MIGKKEKWTQGSGAYEEANKNMDIHLTRIFFITAYPLRIDWCDNTIVTIHCDSSHLAR